MKKIIKKLLAKFCTKISLNKIEHGCGCKCNFLCSFTKATIIGTNCHFNGMKISGSGKVVIGDNFHSGKKCRILTSFHNYDRGSCIPYDETMISKDVIIGDNVWLGEHVYVLGGVTIGEGAVIQAGSIVCQDIPALSVAGGHPAIPFKKRDEEHYFKLKNEKKFM